MTRNEKTGRRRGEGILSLKSCIAKIADGLLIRVAHTSEICIYQAVLLMHAIRKRHDMRHDMSSQEKRMQNSMFFQLVYFF